MGDICAFLDNDRVRTFRFRSERYGYVHHYGIYDKQDLLSFSLTAPPAQFRVKGERILQEVITKKCIHRVTDGNQQLILNKTCDGDFIDKWRYSPSDRHLQDTSAPGQGCFSPWNYAGRPPQDLNITTGLSPCDTWNEIFVEEG